MTPVDAGDRWLILRRAGVMVVLDVGGPLLPRVVHWGADLANLTAADCPSLPSASFDVQSDDVRDGDVPVTLSPSRAHGWPGWPGLTGHRGGYATQPLFTLADVAVEPVDDGDELRYTGEDSAAGLRLDGELRLSLDGVLMHRQTLTNVASSEQTPYTVDDFLTLLPVSEHPTDVLDHAGRWANEAQLQRRVLAQGTWLREQRRGRTGPDTPLLLALGAADVDFRTGELWGVHLGWSGDQRYLAQRLNSGATVIGAGEILAAGEVALASGESVTTPWAYGVYSDRGLDGAAARLHAMLRRRPAHPTKPRPIVLNTWEAVYFDHSFERLAELADVAAEIGVERFVVDDGWFGSRRDDTSGLGDWFVSPEVWPRGLKPLADHVRSRGMEFGLWFEPEMVNLDSEVARAHPDWVLGTPGRMPPAARHQQVLDVSHPDAYGYLVEAISAVVEECGVGYIKWDHNRDLADPVHRGGPRAGRPAVRDQTLATYALMAELKRRHPGLEIESCSSGGSRIDYGVLQHTDRVWASDCIDPIERIRIVSGISTLLPFELIGAHVASGRSHTTGRVHDLSLRLAVALFGHAGFEWDLTATSADERAGLARWVRFAKQVRPLVHGGELVRAQRAGDPGTVVYGVVAPDQREALFNFVRLQTSTRYGSAPVVFPGLDPTRKYSVERVRLPGEGPPVHGPGTKEISDVAAAPGSVLSRTGIRATPLRPDQAVVYHLRAVG